MFLQAFSRYSDSLLHPGESAEAVSGALANEGSLDADWRHEKCISWPFDTTRNKAAADTSSWQTDQLKL